MDIDYKEMNKVYAVIDFARYVDNQYISTCLEDLAEMVDNPIKKQQLEHLISLAWELEDKGYGVCSSTPTV